MPRVKLHNESIYQGYPVNLNHGPLRESDLEGILKLITYSTTRHSRIAVVHLTLNTDINYNTRVPFIDNSPCNYFTKMFSLYMNDLPVAKNIDFQFVRKLEVSHDNLNVHCHMFCVWNYSAKKALSTHDLSIANNIWRTAIELREQNEGLIHVVHGPSGGLNRGDVLQIGELFHWMSYITKQDKSGQLTGVSRLFQTSQIPNI